MQNRTIWTIYRHDLFRTPMRPKGLRILRSCHHKLLEKPCGAYLFISINSEGLSEPNQLKHQSSSKSFSSELLQANNSALGGYMLSSFQFNSKEKFRVGSSKLSQANNSVLGGYSRIRFFYKLTIKSKKLAPSCCRQTTRHSGATLI